LEELYGQLNDPAYRAKRLSILRNIARHGHSNQSASVLLEFLQQDLPNSLTGSAIFNEAMLKADTLIYLGFTGGEPEFKALKDVFLGRNDRLLKTWLPRLKQDGAPGGHYIWDEMARGRAALGLLVSGHKQSEQFVRRYFERMRKRYDRLDDAEDVLFGILVDALVLADQVKTEGTDVLLSEPFVSDFLPDDREARKKYLPR